MDAGRNIYKGWSREQLLVLLQELSSENSELQLELERARLERDRALIDTRLLEMDSQVNKPSLAITGSTSQGYSCSSQAPSVRYSGAKKSQKRQLLKQEQQRLKIEPRAITASTFQEHSSSTKHPSNNAFTRKHKLKLPMKAPPKRPKLEPSSPLPPIPGEKLNEFCLKAFTTFTDKCGKMTDVENYFKHVETKYAVPNRRVLVARLRALGVRGKLIPLTGRKAREHQVYRLPIKRSAGGCVNVQVKKPKLERDPSRKRYFIFCKHCMCVFYLTPLMKGSSFQHTCNKVVVTRNLKVRGKMCKSTAHEGPCIRIARGRERENVRNERYVRLCDRTQMYLDMKKPCDFEDFDGLNNVKK